MSPEFLENLDTYLMVLVATALMLASHFVRDGRRKVLMMAAAVGLGLMLLATQLFGDRAVDRVLVVGIGLVTLALAILVVVMVILVRAQEKRLREKLTDSPGDLMARLMLDGSSVSCQPSPLDPLTP